MVQQFLRGWTKNLSESYKKEKQKNCLELQIRLTRKQHLNFLVNMNLILNKVFKIELSRFFEKSDSQKSLAATRVNCSRLEADWC